MHRRLPREFAPEPATGTSDERPQGRIFQVLLAEPPARPAPGAETGASPSEADAVLDWPLRGCWDPLALVGVPAAPAMSPAASPVASIASQVEPLVAEAVRSIAWGGDRRRGVARLQLGGRYDGASIRVDASDGRLSVELDAPPGIDAAELAERLGERLRARGLDVDSVSVR